MTIKMAELMMQKIEREDKVAEVEDKLDSTKATLESVAMCLAAAIVAFFTMFICWYVTL